MSQTPNWNLVEDTLEQLMRADGTFDRRIESGSHPSPGMKSAYGPVFLRTESSFATVDGGNEGALAIKILAFADHATYGTVAVPIMATAFGSFEDCVAQMLPEQFHLHYLAIAGCLTASPHTTLLKFAIDGSQGPQPWMAHTGLLIVSQENQEQLSGLVSSSGIEQSLLGSIVSEMPLAPYHRCYIGGAMDTDGTLSTNVTLDDQPLPNASQQLEALIHPIFTELGQPGHFQRFLLFAPGTPAE